MQNLDTNSKEYKDLHQELETIVRSEGDHLLDIDRFMQKMRTELTFQEPERVSEINAIPLELIIRLDELE